MEKVAIVILNWNGREMLSRYLPSVLASAGADGVGVYVADNGSTDDSVAMLKRDFPQVHLILLKENHGFADGYNLALQQVDAEYVVLLNSDVEVSEGWLSPLLTYMDAHPEVAACQPKIRSLRQPACFEYAGAAGGYIDRYGYPYCRGRIFHTIEEDRGQYDTTASVFWATGAALFIRLNDYRAVGGLDGRFFAHMEEIDLCWRLRVRGRGVVCVPDSVVYHLGGATLQKESPRKTFLNFRNNLLMLYKNLSEAELKPVMRVRACLDYIAALKFLLTGQVAHARAVMQARREYKALLPDFKATRQENLQQTILTDIPERSNFSILAKFYLKGKRTFTEL